MRHLLSLFLLVLCLSTSLHADEDNSFGVLGGGALANVAASSISDSKIRPGLWLGIYWELPLSPSVNFVPELSFVHKGYNFGSDRSVKLYYLEVPLLMKLKLSDGEGLKTYIFLGPGLGYIVQKSYIDESGSSRLLTDSVSPTNLFELSAQAGIGFEFPISDEWRMGLQGRYSFGITSPFRSETVSNRIIMVGLTIARSESYKYDNIEVRALEYLDRKGGGGQRSAPASLIEEPSESSSATTEVPAAQAEELTPMTEEVQ